MLCDDKYTLLMSLSNEQNVKKKKVARDSILKENLAERLQELGKYYDNLNQVCKMLNRQSWRFIHHSNAGSQCINTLECL